MPGFGPVPSTNQPTKTILLSSILDSLSPWQPPPPHENITTADSQLTPLDRKIVVINQVYQAAEEHRHAEAQTILDAYCKAHGPDVDTLLAQGAIYSWMKRFDEAAGIYRHSIQKFPDDGRAYGALSHILRIQENPEEALKMAQRSYDLNPFEAASLLALSKALCLNNRLKEADLYACFSISKEPTYHVLWQNRGLIRASMGDFENALSDLNWAHWYKPGDENVLIDRSLIKQALGDFEGAHADEAKAFSINPNVSI